MLMHFYDWNVQAKGLKYLMQIGFEVAMLLSEVMAASPSDAPNGCVKV